MGKSTKRRHQSSSVEEVSPAVTRRTSRLTRSKKLKSTVKSSSPVLGKTTVKPRVTPRQQHQEAGPSTARSSRRQSRGRLSNAHMLLDQDCVTPVRPRHSRSSHLHLISPHTATYSESEPEIIWDDKSPNAVQLRRLGKGGKRSAVEDISDIINCVPDVTVDNVNSKPSLLSLWMTRDSPSPTLAAKTKEASTRHSKKTVGKKKARKSRLSALTHELEKVINAIEPDDEEEQDEEEEIQEEDKPALTSSKYLTDSKSATAACSSTTTPVSSSAPTKISTGSTMLTFYTQTKPTQKPTSPRRVPLPAVGCSPDGSPSKPSEPIIAAKPQEKQPCQESKGSGSDESPPGSQTKWEAIGNASAEELWGDDDMFDDDGLLMETIEVEIASSQMVQATPVRKVKKRLSLKSANRVRKSDSDSDAAPTVIPSGAPTIAPTSSDNSKPKTFVKATSTSAIQSQAANIAKPIPSSCPTIPKTTASGPTPNPKSFVSHKSNSTPGFQPFNKQVPTATGSRPSGGAPSSSTSQTNPTRSATYSFRPVNKAPATTAEHQVSKPPMKLPMSTSAIVNSTQSCVSSTTSVLSQNASSTSITRTNPPSVTRVVHSTNAAINLNPPVSNKSIPSSNKFEPFKSEAGPEAQSSIAKNSTPRTASVTLVSTSAQNSQSYLNRATVTASKAYVPYQKRNAVQEPSTSTASAVQPSKSFVAHQGTASQQSKSFVPHQTTCVQQSKPFAGHQGTAGQQLKNLTAHQGTASQQPKSFTAHQGTAGQQPKPFTAHQGTASQQPKSFTAHQGTATQQQKSFVRQQGTAGHEQSKSFIAHQGIESQQSKSFVAHQGTVSQQSKSFVAHQGTVSQQPKSFVRQQRTAVQEAKSASNQQSNSFVARQGTTSQQSKSFVPFSKESAQNRTQKPALHGAKSQPSGQINSSKAYVPFKKVPQTLHSASVASCGKLPASKSLGTNSQQFVTGGKPGQATTHIAPSSCASQISNSNSALVKPHITQSTQSSQQTLMSSQNGGNAKSKSFVPFKKPKSVTDVSRKPFSASSSLYKPAIPSSQNMQVIGSEPNRNTPSMSKSSTSGSTGGVLTMSQSKTFVKHTSSSALTGNAKTSTGSITSLPSNSNSVAKQGTPGYASQAKCSNNNVNLGKVFSPNKGPVNRTSATGMNKNQVPKVSSVGTAPATAHSSVEGGQFDDSLPDEMLMSLVDMDDSWDQF